MQSHWLTAARLVNAQWLAVSVFEDVIDLPGRIAVTPSGPFSPGSPARYHLPMAPLILCSSIGAAWTTRTSSARGPTRFGLACTLSAMLITAHLIGTVNVPLLQGSAAADQRPRLQRRWHRVNRMRVTLLALGGGALELADRRGARACEC